MLVTPATWTQQPWKNGRGVTHEIFRWTDPVRRAVRDYDLRLSVALVDGEQEFSLFPGYWRALVPLDECALTLDARPLVRHHVYELSGDEITGTKGTGKTRDLNVMSRVARARAHVVIATSETAPRAVHLAVIALEPTTLRDPRGTERELGALDTWIELDAGANAFSANVPVVWIRY